MLVLSRLVVDFEGRYGKEYDMTDSTDHLKSTEQCSAIKIPDNRNHKEAPHDKSGMPSLNHVGQIDGTGCSTSYPGKNSHPSCNASGFDKNVDPAALKVHSLK